MNARQRVLLGAIAIGLFVPMVGADEKKTAGSATGTWKSSFKTGDGQSIETIYKLKQEGDKLTGIVMRQGGKERTIENGTIKDGKVSFQISGERDGQKYTVKFQGDLEKDDIKGKVVFSSGGNSRDFDWEAKRKKADK